jgi:MYXO-CTERM domain-containing protein
MDGDGFTEAEGDCDDRNGYASPEAVEVCDGVDNDCDGVIDAAGCDDTAPAPAPEAAATSCGCSADGRGGGAVALAWAALLARRRRR